MSSEGKVPGVEYIAQTDRRRFESLEGSVLEEAQYNQAYKVMDQLHTKTGI